MIHSEGLTRLPLSVDSGSHKSQLTLDFLVADVRLAYNIILGRSGLSAFRAVPEHIPHGVEIPYSRQDW